ncbi:MULTISPECIES: response regulator [Maribacter]|uniref:cAMP-binding domain of CRP or a regulatory subunit of cAMP-dependent protein kinases n=1 Tax=Maribacter stanieri TaxID=440514 RepID=A0A1I6JWY7_9FLAO|nr:MULTISPECIES: response regulator [Maribacter]SFR83463.1 cAMP-binding domain of CRP or a regulatory subunit of cAMP-dependent protein kinases [Maribacter stanieri]|tara:strand:- start:650 stop:1702 length:1053 start_codon:yes stop_codon:yes gene_type:complete
MKRILLIEDDKALRENTEELLELCGYNVTTASNGRIGIEAAIENLPDIIICDIMMPEVDGYGVLENLSNNEKTKQIPFIFLSAKTEHKEIRKGMDLGADDYLTKPFEEEDLTSAIESRLAKAELIKRMQDDTSKEHGVTENEIQSIHELKNFFDDNGELASFKQGEIIFQEGVRSNKIYLILKGLVKCYSMDSDGKELITSLNKADDFLGFTSFLNNVPYQESATALEAVELAGISKDNLKEILGENNNISLELMELLSQNISNIKAQLLQMAYSSVRRKTAQTLLQFADIMNTNKDEPIKISRNDLASVAGIATESLIRTLSGFKKEGLITIEGRNIQIKELKALQYVN